MSNFSPMFFEQPIVIFDTTESLNSTSGAFVLYGGVSINAKYQTVDTSSGAFVLSGGMAVQKDISVGGIQRIYNIVDSVSTSTGALIVDGGVGIKKSLNVGGIQHIYHTAESTSINDGALIVDGGVGIEKNLNVGGDTYIAGNTTIMGSLYVEGTYTYVNTTTINVEDNTLVINSGPGGSRDAGLLIHRSGSDVTSVTETPIITDTLSSAIATTAGSVLIILPATLPPQTDNYYRGWWIKTIDGYGQITSYSAGTRVAALSTSGSTLTTSGTTMATAFDLYNKSYLAQYYDELSDEIRFAYVADATDPKIDLENGNNYARLRLDKLDANTSISTSSIYTTGLSTIANLAVTNLLVASVTMDNAALKSATIGNLYVTGASVLHGSVTAGALNVTGASLLQLGVSAGSLNVTGESVLHGSVTAGALNVTGASLLQLGVSAGSLNVTGESVLHGSVTAGALNVTGASLLQLGVTAGALNVTGASLLQLGLTAGSLNVTGESWLQGAVTAGALNVTGNSILQGFVTAGSLNVVGDSIIQSDFTVTTGNITISTNDYLPIKENLLAGGSILFNTVDVSPSLGDIARERYARINNNQGSATPVIGFAFNSSVRAFDAIVSVVILAGTGNRYAYYNLKGIKKASNWVVNSSYVGDVTGVTFSITNGGQMQYTSTDVTERTNGYANFRAMTTSIVAPEPTF